jgi:hypothetical protein
LAVSDFRLRARLDISIPSTPPASEAFNPAFGYGAPHPSAGGTSTLLINALLSTHHGSIGDSWPIDLLGYPRGRRVSPETSRFAALPNGRLDTLPRPRASAERADRAVKSAFFAAERTLDGQDRSARIPRKGMANFLGSEGRALFIMRESSLDSPRRCAAPSPSSNLAQNSHTGLLRRRSFSSNEV